MAKEGSPTTKYVYLLQSISHPGKRYIGRSADYVRRLAGHNAGKSPYTANHRPWEAVLVMRFEDDVRADAFERYLKSGSGHAFAQRHFW